MKLRDALRYCHERAVYLQDPGTTSEIRYAKTDIHKGNKILSLLPGLQQSV